MSAGGGHAPPVIEIAALSKRFVLRHNRAGQLKVRALSLVIPAHRERREEFWALRDVSLQIRRGDAVGIVGRNGSGKSTLLRLVAGLQRPTAGALRIAAGLRIATMIELGVGFHPELTGLENARLNASIYGLRRREIDARLPAIVEESGLAQFIDQPLRSYSSGMQMRLGFAVAMQTQPDVLLLDEIFAIGDPDFRSRCLAALGAFRARGGSLLLVSHAPETVSAVCDRVCVLDRGRVAFDGPVAEGLARYERLTQTKNGTAP